MAIPWTDTPSIPRPSATSAANCSVRVHPGRARRHAGAADARRRHPHRARRLAALHRPARGHALATAPATPAQPCRPATHARHAAQRPGLHRRRQHPDLQLRHRPAGNHGPRRAHPHADRQHRRPAHRQGQLRAARYQGPRLAHRLDAGEPMDRALADRVRDGYVAVVEDGRIRVVADGFHFTNEIRLDAREQWLYIVETTGPRITRMRLDESRQAKSGWSTAKSSAPPTWAACPTASRSTRTAICGPR